ncbi:uncharacterized protein DDB_G0271670 isoform X1 [Momordica charantia]|uniref:Uncharacterized protein DDB_G0271670 isoform X1 n=1 Tax=Momordica charantia TaxID=3673 RepID=A0A6J1BTH3_MOMCH|nr:uncharacterized protein DDB_G0271670 isoform X1 [Momordica charantia]XP_022131478.1 uncharacterized protein DDB_G0271670 isoform X1 [Momordica charantia]
MATSRASFGKERRITAPTSLTIPNYSTKRTPKSSPRSQQTDHKLAYSSSFSSSSSSSSTSSKLTSSSSSPSLSMLSEKHVPNYLKSTASSRHDHGSFKTVKKFVAPAPIPEGKASLNRRRSFDKPPPTAPRLDKPFRSPGPRSRATHVPVRSSSFGSKPAPTFPSSAKPGHLERSSSSKTSPKVEPSYLERSSSAKTSSKVEPSHLERSSSSKSSSKVEPSHLERSSSAKTSSKVEPSHLERSSSSKSSSKVEPSHLERSSSSKSSSKVGGKPQQPVQNLRSGSNAIAKKSLRRESSNAGSALAEIVPKAKNIAVEQAVHSPSFVLGVNEEELKKIECELDPYLPDPMPELDKEIRTDHVEKKVDVLDKEEADAKHEAEKQPIQDTEISKADTETPSPIEVEAKLLIQEESNRERTEGVGEEEVKDEEKPEIITQEKEVDKDEEKSEISPTQEGIVVLDQKEVEDGENCKEEAEVTEKVAAAEKEGEAVAEKLAVMGAKQRQGSGRKESPAMYNDVIEETASKLLEKRQNKVKALAGAFQTVIDYESSSK